MDEAGSAALPPLRKDRRHALRELCGQAFPAITCLGREWLGATLIGVEDEGLALRFTVEARHCGPDGIIGAPLLLAFMDEVIGATLMVQGRRLISLSLSASFFGPATIGEPLDIHTAIVASSGRRVCVRCDIAAGNRPIAGATCHALVPVTPGAAERSASSAAL